MIEVDTVTIKKYINKLNSYSSELEQIHLELFNQLKNSCIDWQDGNSLYFEDAVYIDQKEAHELINNIKSINKVYSLIYNKYSVLGKNIKCNLKNKTIVMKKIDECYNQVCSILEQFSLIDRSFNYDERYYIDEQQSKMEIIKKELHDLYNKINHLFSNIETIESEIRSATSKLQEFEVKEFDFGEEFISA